MSDKTNDTGVLTMVAKRMVEERLPRALALEEKVGRGEALDDFDMAFLQEVFKDASAIKPLLATNPEYRETAARMLQLYKDVIAKALANEQASQKR